MKKIIFSLIIASHVFATGFDIDTASDLSNQKTLSASFETVLAWTNNFTESGKLVIVGGARLRNALSPGIPESSAEVWTKIYINGTPFSPSVRFHELPTNRVGFALSSISFAEAVDINPGQVIIGLSAMLSSGNVAYFDEPVMNFMFVPDSSSVTCYVARAFSVELTQQGDFQNIVSTNLPLSAGQYILIGSGSMGLKSHRYNGDFRVGSTDRNGPEIETELTDVGTDGMDECITTSFGEYVSSINVTNFFFQGRTFSGTATCYSAVLIIIYQQDYDAEFQLDDRIYSGNWEWSPSVEYIENKTNYYDLPRRVLHLCSLGLYATDLTARCQAKLFHETDMGTTPNRQKELANNFSIPRYYAAHLSAVYDVPSGSNTFFTQVNHPIGTGNPPLFSYNGERWQTFVAIPIPEPVLFFIFYLGLWFINSRCPFNL